MPIKSKRSATGMATKIKTKQATIILRKPFNSFTPGLSSCSIFISIVSTKISKKETLFTTHDCFFD